MTSSPKVRCRPSLLFSLVWRPCPLLGTKGPCDRVNSNPQRPPSQRPTTDKLRGIIFGREMHPISSVYVVSARWAGRKHLGKQASFHMPSHAHNLAAQLPTPHSAQRQHHSLLCPVLIIMLCLVRPLRLTATTTRHHPCRVFDEQRGLKCKRDKFPVTQMLFFSFISAPIKDPRLT